MPHFSMRVVSAVGASLWSGKPCVLWLVEAQHTSRMCIREELSRISEVSVYCSESSMN